MTPHDIWMCVAIAFSVGSAIGYVLGYDFGRRHVDAARPLPSERPGPPLPPPEYHPEPFTPNLFRGVWLHGTSRSEHIASDEEGGILAGGALEPVAHKQPPPARKKPTLSERRKAKKMKPGQRRK